MVVNKTYLLIGSRIFFALLGFSAIVTEIATLSERDRFIPSNFVSYFTVEANLFAVIVLVLSALALASNRQSGSVALLRGSSTLNMIVVGIVFSLLLADIDAELTAVPWDNAVLHYIMPVYVALDWFIDLPKVRITFKRALVWMVFPIAYVAYSLIRGRFVGWYPYPFLNPVERGYLGVTITSVEIALGAAGLIWVLARFTGRDGSKNVIQTNTANR
jgi:hypothetical protein